MGANTINIPISQSEKILDQAFQVKEESDSRPPYSDLYMIGTFLIASTLALLIYVVTDYVWLEVPTKDAIRFLLTMVGIENYDAPGVIEDFLRGEGIFYEAVDETPGIYLPDTNTKYWIVKACTGMQAGALMLSLIAISNAKWKRKLIASVVFFVALFVGNVLRITFHLVVTYILHVNFGLPPMEAFYWGHDIPTKIIGFFGTLFFAWLINQMGVPIIDTFADYVDYAIWRATTLYKKIF